MQVMKRKTLGKRVGIFAILVAMILSLGVPMMSFADTAYPSDFAGGVINIYKLKIADTANATPETDDEITGAASPATQGRTPVAGVKFTLVPVHEVSAADYAAAGGDKYTVGGRYFVKAPGANPTESNPTDAAGHTSFTGLKLGSYYISETTSVNGVTPCAPFVVNIPTTVNGNAVTTVNVYPKGYESKLEKETSAQGGTASVGDVIDWTIKATVPADYNYVVGGTTAFSITDRPSAGLKFVDGSEEVKINGAIPALVKNTDYSVTPGAPYAGGTAVTFTFLPAGLAKLHPGDIVTVKLDTEILDAASSVDPTTNEASLDYTNSSGTDSSTTTDPGDKPAVKIGGLSFYKVDPIKGIGLDGATFKLVKKSANGGFAADLAAAKADSHSDNDGYYKNIATGVTFSATSGAGGTLGKIEFTGLAYGEYWLVETAAPSGYRLIGEPIAVEVGATTGANPTSSYDHALTLADAQKNQFTTPGLGTPINTLTIANYEGFEFPLTGGMGTLLFVVIGIGLVGLAGIVIVSRRKSEEAAE